MQEDLKDMQARYTDLAQDVKTLKNGQTGIQENMNALNGQFEKINSNMESIMFKLDVISEDRDKNLIGKMMKEKESFLSKIKNPLRKLAVCTVGAIMSMTDYTVEKASGAREGLEDIVAEASYNNKKKRDRMTEETDTSEA